MISKSQKQFDLFSKDQSLWHQQSKQTKSQLHDQLALLLLSCLYEKGEANQPNTED